MHIIDIIILPQNLIIRISSAMDIKKAHVKKIKTFRPTPYIILLAIFICIDKVFMINCRIGVIAAIVARIRENLQIPNLDHFRAGRPLNIQHRRMVSRYRSYRPSETVRT